MKNPFLINRFQWVFIGIVFFFACTLKTKTPAPICLCPEYPIFPTSFNFKLIDKTSGKDLVFGSGAKLSLSQIKASVLLRGTSDSLTISPDSVRKLLTFFVFTDNSYNSRPPIDTVTLKIQGYPQNILLFNFNRTIGCCPRDTLSTISLDGTQICMPCNGFVATISK